jgi:hypothetical protein
MADSVWASIKPDWHEYARCKGVDLNEFDAVFYPADENDAVALAFVQSTYCNICPVRGKCLNSAVINKDWGLWAGTTRAMRQAMSRTRSRAKCPLCLSVDLVAVDEYEVCTRCGASWRAESRPTGKHQPEAATT